MYIVIEGQDGTGKSTQAELLKKHFESAGKEVVMLEEPDGDLPQAHDLHDMILTRGYNLEPLTNVLLFTAARVELWKKIAEPVLKRGGVVISARNYWSTLAYQGYGRCYQASYWRKRLRSCLWHRRFPSCCLRLYETAVKRS